MLLVLKVAVPCLVVIASGYVRPRILIKETPAERKSNGSVQMTYGAGDTQALGCAVLDNKTCTRHHMALAA